jgi:hypothetical protein
MRTKLNLSTIALAVSVAVTQAIAQSPAIGTATVNDATSGGFEATRITWADANGQSRTADLARYYTAAAPDPLGTRGGFLTRFTYALPGGTTRTIVPVRGLGDGGFGYIVSHLADASAANRNGEDDSPLSSGFGSGTAQLAFAGKHHVIYQYTLNYPRWAINYNNNQTTRYNVPVTIQWIFMTGRSHPIWAVTYDLSAAPAGDGQIYADSRAPYGHLAFDGSNGTIGASDNVGGIAWGDAFKFRTTDSMLSLNSTWTWANPNRTVGNIPYVYMWTQSTDAEMGLVGITNRTVSDAGGKGSYFVSAQEPARYVAPFFHGKTSANQPALNANCPYENPKNYLMPCINDVWPYQANANGIAFGPKDKKMTWGTMYGFLGSSNYRNSENTQSFIGTGYPKASYAVTMVLDRKSIQPSEAEISRATQNDGASIAVAAGFGSLKTNVRRGVADTRTVSNTKGIDAFVTGGYTLSMANVSELRFDIAPQAGQRITAPLFIIEGFGTGTPIVTRGGTTLVADRDYFASNNTQTGELWMTLAQPIDANTTISVKKQGTISPTQDTDGDGVPDVVEQAQGTNPNVKDNDVITNSRYFVNQLYRDFLSREADASGAAFFTNQLTNQQITRARLVLQFTTSGEFEQRTAPMARLYFGTYLRVPDYAGLQFWTEEFRSGRRTLVQIGEAFATAPEFVNRYGANVSNANFVALVYQNILGRTGEPAGVNFWTEELNSGRQTRGSMLTQFTESSEYKAARAAEINTTLLYSGLLKRAPTQTEFNFAVTTIKAGGSPDPTERVANDMLNTLEYRRRFLN